jgi:hypothetical protein
LLINSNSSTIIEEVIQHCQDDPSVAYAYFYFDFNEGKKRLVQSLAHSLVTQFSDQCLNTPVALAALFSKSHNGNQQPKLTQITQVLFDIIKGFRHAYIVIDAFDECIEHDNLIFFIKEMLDWKLENLHILVTSRPERFIDTFLKPRVSGVISIDGAIVGADIEAYVHERLSTDSRMKRWPLEYQNNVHASLTKGANGM